MKKINASLISWVFFVSTILGIMIEKIGDFAKVEKYTWYDPILVVFILAGNFYCGWAAHKEHIKGEE